MTVLGGRYEIKHRLGEGGMGVVYRAEDLRLRRDVALKLLAATGGDDSRFYFHREARAIAALEHPNIVPIYDYSGPDEEPAFIVMALVQGGSLEQLVGEMAAAAASPEVFIVSALRGIAAALAFAHDKGVVHRDIKPGNVLIDQHGRVLLSDFGLAKAFRDAEQLGKTYAGQNTSLMGTPDFLAPEQVARNESGPDSDVFSLGCLAYWLSVGRSPFAGSDPVDSLRRIHEGRFVPLPQARPGLSAELYDWVAGSLRAVPYERPSSAELAERTATWLKERGVADATSNVREVLHGRSVLSPATVALVSPADELQTVVAPPIDERPDSAPRESRLARRPTPFLVAAVIFVVAVATGVGALAVWRRQGSDSTPQPAAGSPGSTGIVSSSSSSSSSSAAAAAAPVGAPSAVGTPGEQVPPPPAPSLILAPAGTLAPAGSEPVAQTSAQASAPAAGIPGRPSRVGARPSKSKAAASAKVTVEIEVEPWGEVSVDGEVLGNTPFIRQLSATPGKHLVEVAHPKLGTQRRTVVFGKEARVVFNLH